ncbi:hypothetical protein QUF90_18565 [Desulfococcaceae bacterium HSG9]|nr:hypothetical protein [Desulfococcaceae bacterium HSG9]
MLLGSSLSFAEAPYQDLQYSTDVGPCWTIFPYYAESEAVVNHSGASCWYVSTLEHQWEIQGELQRHRDMAASHGRTIVAQTWGYRCGTGIFQDPNGDDIDDGEYKENYGQAYEEFSSELEEDEIESVEHEDARNTFRDL